MDNYAQLRDAVLGASNVQAPTDNPLGASTSGLLANKDRGSYQLAAASPASGALAASTNETVQAQKAAAAAEAKRKAAMADPNNYQRIKKADGGFAFVAPDGTEISAYDYANIIGSTPDKVLADSENPIDVGYQQDFKNLQDYMNAKVNYNNDKKAKATADQIEADVKESQGIDLRSMELADVVKRLKEAYPTVYGGNKAGVKAGTTLLSSGANAGAEPDDPTDPLD